MLTKQKSKAAQSWHRYHVYHDPSFVADIQALPSRYKSGTQIPSEQSVEDNQILADKWGLSATDVDFVRERDWSDFDPTVEIGGSTVWFNPQEDRLVASLNVQITKSQILKLYKEISRLREESGISMSKYKAPDDTELLYAIFKRRKATKTFKEIFEEYQAGILPGYENKPTNQYSSDDALETYYKKHYTRNA